MTRISSGNIDLDKRLQGGFPEGECVLITGEPGTGKTILCIQFLYNACKQGKKCMMIATEETPEKILLHAKMLGFDLEPFFENKQLSMIHFLEMRAKNVTDGYNNISMYIDDLNNLGHIIQEDTEVVVLDNMGTFSIGMDLKTFKDKIEKLAYVLSNQKMTSLLMMDGTAHELTHRIAEYSTYGTIKLMVKENPYTGKMERFMHIPKMRGTEISLDPIIYDITDEGIKLSISQGKKD
ncbi:ATPase domain-containing protein [Methanolobus sp. ZRKC4]|uniref:RAD55 family ATPase n=1 Tax=Methanolobus sp. ZRKC4 TaxID=3125787 RepID=UPI00324D5485